MKPGVRAAGVAWSGEDAGTSTLAAAVVRGDRIVDGLAYGECTVGGDDATRAVVEVLERLDRPDVRYVVLGAVAPAWYNVLDLDAIAAATDRPVVAVTFEASDGLEAALDAAFTGAERMNRLERYRSLPDRRSLSVGDETVYVRSVGLTPDRADEVVRRFTVDGGRPEPIRVARLAARAADAYRR